MFLILHLGGPTYVIEDIDEEQIDYKTKGSKNINIIAFGDINLDGIVNKDDVNFLRQYLKENVELENDALTNADLNMDGNVDNIDELILKKYLEDGHTYHFPIVFGDVNRDYKLTQDDMELLGEYFVKDSKSNDEQSMCADLNGDGIFNDCDFGVYLYTMFPLMNWSNIKEYEGYSLPLHMINNKKLKCNVLDEMTIISGFESKNITVKDLISNFTQQFNNCVYDINGIKLEDNELIGTGTVVKIGEFECNELIFTLTGEVKNGSLGEYNIVIYGDTNGDGDVNSVDALGIIKNKLGVQKFSNKIYEEAGRISETTRNAKSVPSAVDALAIVKYKLGLGTIEQYNEQIEDETMLGMISIPKIELSNKILGQVSTERLNKAVCVLYGDLEQNKNTVIIGKNNNDGTLFSNLKQLENEDIIEITDNKGEKTTYKIYNVFETFPEDTSFYNRDTKGLKEISLVTTTDDNSKRLVVCAKEYIDINLIKTDVYNNYCNTYTGFNGITIINGIENSENYGEIISRFSIITESIVNKWDTYLKRENAEKCKEHYNYIMNLGNAVNIQLKYNDYNDLTTLWSEIYDIDRILGNTDIKYGVSWLGSKEKTLERIGTDFYGIPSSYYNGTHYGKYRIVGLLNQLRTSEFERKELIIDEEKNIKEIIYVIINEKIDDVSTFNNKFKEYEGIIDGTKLEELIELAFSTNVFFNINGLENVDNIVPTQKYRVTFMYNSDGYIDTINITQYSTSE